MLLATVLAYLSQVIKLYCNFILLTDSPGIPPSATAHELFRGFSYVAPILLDDNMSTSENHDPQDQSRSISHVSKCTSILNQASH